MKQGCSGKRRGGELSPGQDAAVSRHAEGPFARRQPARVSHRHPPNAPPPQVVGGSERCPQATQRSDDDFRSRFQRCLCSIVGATSKGQTRFASLRSSRKGRSLCRLGAAKKQGKLQGAAWRRARGASAETGGSQACPRFGCKLQKSVSAVRPSAIDRRHLGSRQSLFFTEGAVNRPRPPYRACSA